MNGQQFVAELVAEDRLDVHGDADQGDRATDGGVTERGPAGVGCRRSATGKDTGAGPRTDRAHRAVASLRR
jgi:hypothetical protein